MTAPVVGEDRPCAFVAGATGYTGREVVRVLVERGVAVIAHVRPDSPTLERWRERFGTMQGTMQGGESGPPVRVDTTAWDRFAMGATLSALRPTHVFALLGTTRARGRRAAREKRAAETYETVDYGLAALLLHAAVTAGRATGKWPRFVYLSSLGASPSSQNTYLAVRGRIEDELRGSGLSYVIARPALVTGRDREERRPNERAAATITDAMLSLVGALGAHSLKNRFSSLSGPELAHALVALALDPPGQGVVAEADVLRARSRPA